MSNRIEALINGDMLATARRQTGLTLAAAAKRLQISEERLLAWEQDKSRPTIRQALDLAEIYHRPLSFFYLKEPPKDFTVAITDFRRMRGDKPRSRSPALLWEQRQADIRREVMLDLEEDETKRFGYLNAISLESDPEIAGVQIREILGVSWKTQASWLDTTEAFSAWREAIEGLNVLVCHTDYLGLTVDLDECRGFSLSAPDYPVIVINTKDATGGRIFTLLHEFAHLLLNAGGLCDLELVRKVQSDEQRVEVFCNHVAGAILVPPDVLKSRPIFRAHDGGDYWEDEEIYNLAVEFNVSQLVIIRRLLILGLTTREFYETKQQEYEEAWKAFREKKRNKKKSKGGPPVHIMAIRRNGGIFTRQVFSAYYDKQIGLVDVSDYLGVKIKHIKEIENQVHFGGSGE